MSVQESTMSLKSVILLALGVCLIIFIWEAWEAWENCERKKIKNKLATDIETALYWRFVEEQMTRGGCSDR